MGMSLRAYAKHRGVSHTAVQKAIRTGRITPEADGTIEPTAADAQWDANTRPGQSLPGHDSTAHDYAADRAIREHYEAQLKRLEFEEKSGKLVDKDEVNRTVFALARSTRDRLLQIPRRLSAHLAAEPDARTVEDILEEAIRDALAGLEVLHEQSSESP